MTRGMMKGANSHHEHFAGGALLLAPRLHHESAAPRAAECVRRVSAASTPPRSAHYSVRCHTHGSLVAVQTTTSTPLARSMSASRMYDGRCVCAAVARVAQRSVRHGVI